MESREEKLENILSSNSEISINDVSSVLIVLDEDYFAIGDSCMRLDRIKYFRSFFLNARIHIVFLHEYAKTLIEDLLQENPNVDSCFTSEWPEIRFEKYDIVFLSTKAEDKVLELLYDKYSDLIRQKQFKVSFYSVSNTLKNQSGKPRTMFPVHQGLENYINLLYGKQGNELYITEDERKWGDKWLESKGIKPGEELFIILDSASDKEKLLKVDVYFEFFTLLLNRKDIRILNFDENGLGKETFYREWLGDENAERIIFSRNLKLRETFCIMGSKYTRLVFGPCTGLIHCASAIYNSFLYRGICRIQDIPLLIVYTGVYPEPTPNANFWWGNAPLVSCLLLRRNGARIEMAILNDLTEEQKGSYQQIPCSEYTASMLISFAENNLDEKYETISGYIP
jgi:hypothetical protein